MTEAVAPLLGADGRFRSVASAPEFEDEISLAAAEEIGLAYLRTFGPLLRRTLEADHMAPIDFAEVQLCGRRLYLHSSFEPLGIEAPSHLVAAAGGEWLLQYCFPPGVKALLHNVPSRTLLRVVSGRLQVPLGSSAGIVTFGIPLGRPSLTQDPERAVELVYKATSTRIDAVPVAVHDNFTIGPITAENGRPIGSFWKLRTERPVAVVQASTGERRVTNEFYVVLGYSSRSRDSVYVTEGEVSTPFWVRTPSGDSVRLAPRVSFTLRAIASCMAC